MHSRPAKLLLVVASTLASLIAAELGFRLYLRTARLRDLERAAASSQRTVVNSNDLGDIVRLCTLADLVYELKPDLSGSFFGKPLRTNALGMRTDKVVARDKLFGTKRVVGLGDSFMFGQGVGNGDTYLDLLETSLRSQSVRVEVLSFAAPGYTAASYAAMLEVRAGFFEPDVIVVGIIGNDWEVPHFLLTGPARRPLGSALLGSIWERRRAASLLPTSGTPMDMYFKDIYSIEAVPPEYRHMVEYPGFVAALARIHARAKELGAKVILFSDCMKEREGEPGCDFPFKPGEREALWKRIRGEWQFGTCAWSLPAESFIPGDGHPSAEGQRALAAQLEACLEQEGW